MDMMQRFRSSDISLQQQLYRLFFPRFHFLLMISGKHGQNTHSPVYFWVSIFYMSLCFSGNLWLLLCYVSKTNVVYLPRLHFHTSLQWQRVEVTLNPLFHCGWTFWMKMFQFRAVAVDYLDVLWTIKVELRFARVLQKHRLTWKHPADTGFTLVHVTAPVSAFLSVFIGLFELDTSAAKVALRTTSTVQANKTANDN